MPQLVTTLGAKTADQLGLVLPHEHVFVDLRTQEEPGFGEADPADVVALMAPELGKAREAGVTAIVECSPVGVGRRVDIVDAVSRAANFPLVVPTGIYREPWVPPWAHAASEEELAEWMRKELVEGIEETGVKAAFIKLSAGDDGLTECETKILRAAARAGTPTGAAIGSHTIRGRVVRDQLDVVEGCGYPAERFIWIHAQIEPDLELNLEMARRGVWVEYDNVGSDGADDEIIRRIGRFLAAGMADRLLLSHDNGWYDPAQPGGGVPRPYTHLSEEFLPKLHAAGVDQSTIDMITRDNPFRAFAR